MKSTVIKHSIILAGHKTSISLEDEFWDGLREIAAAQNMTITGLVSRIDSRRQGGSLSSALRLFVLRNYRDQRRQEKSTDASFSSASGERETSTP